ncbi:hypothetical protein [Tistrella mobilis]|jgi:hypothetical protein|uniref:hypothetical protein n=1 Tax=Tistrella mobilis TaxID=171437 RepID=UPI0035583099
MTPDSFCRLLDAWGADISRWPEDRQAAARACLEAHPDLLVPLARAAALDAALLNTAPQIPDREVAAAIAAVGHRLKTSRQGAGRAGRIGWPLAALAGAAAILLAIGLHGLHGTADGAAMMTLLFDSDLILLDGAVR